MAGRIRDEDIAAVRERSPIDEVVGEYLQLRNAGGGSLKGLCPFHDEKTPSFNVTPARGLYYCFSCAAGGDVIQVAFLANDYRRHREDEQASAETAAARERLCALIAKRLKDRKLLAAEGTFELREEAVSKYPDD